MSPFSYSDSHLAELLSRALTANQLRLFVQPQSSLRLGRVVSGEVLLRMPTLQPSDFLPSDSLAQTPYTSVSISQWIQTALNQGLIYSLSEWIVKSVFRILQDRSQTGYGGIPLSVNMPPEMINQDFVKLMENCLETHCDVPPHQVAIEITEFPKAKNLRTLNQSIQRLRAMGIKVILDDFGSGYATMNYLVELEVDAVKIDQSIIQKAPQSQSARAVLRCLVELATELNIEVICEGVETLEQLFLLQEMNCDIIQGFLISEAIPFDQFWQNLETGFKPILH